MSYPSPVTASTATADVAAVGAGSVQFAAIGAVAGTMDAGAYYLLVANTDLWFKQGANPTASAAAGSTFLPARASMVIDAALGAKLAVIQDSTGGKASLTRIKFVK